MNKKVIIIVAIALVVLMLLCGCGAVASYFLYQNYQTNQKTQNSDNPNVWNGSADYDKNLFETGRYKSGDVYLASCFESAVPKDFEITYSGFVPRVGVVKPKGPAVEEYYYPYIDIRFHE